MRAYLRVLEQEIIQKAPEYAEDTVISIYIGGGTPTAVPVQDLCRVVETVRSVFCVAENAEISMECNPGTVTKESLQKYRACGINRLSIGLQSARNEELRRLGRIHTFEQFLTTYREACEAGFDNINVDLMSALPGQSVEDYEESLNAVLQLEPQVSHISAYSLIVEEGTPFYELYGKEKEELERTGEKQPGLPSEEEEREMYRLTARRLQDAGYEHYEISNYSLPGKACRHNCVYWERGKYLGVGLGAASLTDECRYTDTRVLTTYLQGDFGRQDEEKLTMEDQMAEFLFLGLRMMKGVSFRNFEVKFGRSMESVYEKVMARFEKEGLLTQEERDGERYLLLTENGIDVANYVMAQFLPED